MQINFQQLNALKTSLEKLQPLSLSFKTKYQLTKLATSLDKNLEFYQNSFRQIIEDYAEKDENGEIKFVDENKQQISIPQEKIKECNEKFASLSEVQYDMPDIELDENCFNDLEVDLTYAEIDAISLFFKN